MSDRASITRKVELVKTYNLVRALNRMNTTSGVNAGRAIYHALLMMNTNKFYLNNEKLAVIRTALGLP